MNTVGSKQKLFLRCVNCTAVVLSLMLAVSSFAYEKEVNALSAAMAEKIAKTDRTSVAVVDFTDLEGNVTQLGRFIAEEFSMALAGTGKEFKVVDRTHLNSIIKENKLSATGLIDPETTRKLGEIIGVQALITGTLTPFGDTVRVAVKVLDTATAEVIDAARGNIAKTQGIEELLGKELTAKERNPSYLSGKERKGIPATRVERKDIVFELQHCKISYQKIKCFLSITAKEQDRNIAFGWKGWGGDDYSRIFDNYGNEYYFSEAQVGNKVESGTVRSYLVADVPTRSSISFEGVRSDISSLALLEINIVSEGEFVIQFRDITLSK